MPHAYGNKYELAEALGSVSLAGLINVLEVLGLNGKTLRVLKEWSEERGVTLRFKAEERCEFDRETKREQESDITCESIRECLAAEARQRTRW